MKEYTPQILTFSELVEKARLLPKKPGIYLYYDKDGKIIYVGKSRALHNRVLSYFQNVEKHPPKTRRLVQSIADFQTIVTSSDQEALILENEKIKLHRPKFNIRLKDDRNYPYIRLSTAEEYPRLSLAHRRRPGDKSLYFGPYGSSQTVHTAIHTANTMFHLPTCKRTFPRDIGKERPCLYYHLGRCSGVCTGAVSKEEYQKQIDGTIHFLKHDHKKVIDLLQKEMERDAENLLFERAAAKRDTIRSLQNLSQARQVVKDLHYDADVFGAFAEDWGGCINLLRVREGRVVDNVHFHFGADEILSPDSFFSLLVTLYRGKDFPPKKVLVPESLWNEENEALSPLLSDKDQMHFLVPQRGEGKNLVQMASENAKEAALHRRTLFEKDEAVLAELAMLLSLEVVPERIESIDISNSGTSAVYAGIICIKNAHFLKSAYKSFSIDRDKPDDPACMYEAVSRRLMRYKNGDMAFSPLPDLILADGGATQVAAVKKALSDAGISIPVFGMVKDAFHKTRCLTDGTNEINILHNQKIFQFLYKIQEEVHRFSLSRMDAKRRKSVKTTELSKIPGIGEKKAQILYRRFKSMKAIRALSAQELSDAPGISQRDGERIFAYFHPEEETP